MSSDSETSNDPDSNVIASGAGLPRTGGPRTGGEIVAPDGVATAMMAGGSDSAEDTPDGTVPGASEASGVESPAKIIRIGAMVKQLLEELRETELDEHSRDQLRDIYSNSVTELKTAVSPELAEELDSLSFAFDEDDLPSAVELRMAKAQLVGWLEGLFHGMQAALMAQQMSMRQQVEGMRQQLPEAKGPHHGSGPGYL